MRPRLLPSALFVLAAAGCFLLLPAHAQSLALGGNPGTVFHRMIANSELIFIVANNRVFGTELWAHDPKTETTYLVKDVFPGEGSSVSDVVYVWNDILYFAGNDGKSGSELWRSDGTAVGTYMVKDINTLHGHSSYPHHFGASGDALYFVAHDGKHGFELWKTKGDEDSTVLVADLHPPEVQIGTTFAVTPFPAFALFRGATRMGDGELWRTDGTPEGTYEIAIDSLNVGAFEGGMVRLHDFALFVARTEAAGVEIWRTSGNAADTALVKDIAPGRADADPNNLKQFNDRVLFQAGDPEHGMELWITDGTAEGTRLVKDIFPGVESSNPAPFCVAGEKAFFVAEDGVHGRELWVTDGTEAGTHLVMDMFSGAQSSNPYQMTAFGDRIFFSANHARVGEELWITDGTSAGTKLVKDINPGPALSEPYHLTVLGEYVYFEATDGKHGFELWRSDGSREGTQMIADITWPPAPAPSSDPAQLTVGAEAVYFHARVVDGTRRLHRTHPSRGTIVEQAAAPVIKNEDHCLKLEPYNGGVCALVDDGDSRVAVWLWPDDSTEALEVSVLDRRRSEEMTPSMAVTENAVYFASPAQPNATEVRLIDLQSPDEAIDVNLVDGPGSAYPTGLTAIGTHLFLSAKDPEHGRELWRIVGSDAALLQDIRPGPEGSAPAGFTSINGRVYFTADDGAHGPELWVWDEGTGSASLVADIHPAQQSQAPRPSELTAFGDVLLFAANDGVHGTELWRSKGTPETTEMVRDIFPGRPSSGPAMLTVVGDRVYFTAEAPGKGAELFVTDGTSDGTRMVVDLVPGPEHAQVGWITPYLGGVAFTARAALNGAPLSSRRLRWTDGTAINEIGVPADSEEFDAADLIALDDSLFFTAMCKSLGREVLRTRPSDTGFDTSGYTDLLQSTRTRIEYRGEEVRRD
jgi:ELWxxDGT repeat protein